MKKKLTNISDLRFSFLGKLLFLKFIIWIVLL